MLKVHIVVFVKLHNVIKIRTVVIKLHNAVNVHNVEKKLNKEIQPSFHRNIHRYYLRKYF